MGPQEVGVAVIGCGGVGRKRVESLPAGCRVVALADEELGRAEALAAVLPYPVRTGRSAGDALAGGDVQLAIVATVHAALAPVTRDALAAGADVLVEKPGGRCLAEVLETQGVAERGGQCVRVGFNHRFHPAILRARELIATHAWGDLMSIRARYGHGGRLGYEREWRAARAVSGGGELLDQGVHLIDLTRFLVGDVDLAFAELRTDFWGMDVEDNAYLALRPRAGGFAWLHASWTEWKNLFSFEVAFRGAKLEVTGLGGSYGTERLALYEMLPAMGPPATTIWEWPQRDQSWERETADMLTARTGGPSLGATLADCAAALSIVEQAYAR